MKREGQFRIKADYVPGGDQPAAIEKLADGFLSGALRQTLLGVTGSGKTFTMANLVARYNRPTLVISHNKTLAAQLFSEMRVFFPDNAVEYFVSYYDYYQPEAYVPSHDLYIEKDSSVNEQIDRMRLAATSALMERNDVVVVASVSCIYGIGSPKEYEKRIFHVNVGDIISREEFSQRLVDLLYDRDEVEFAPGRFRMRGDTVEVFPPYQEKGIRFTFWGNAVESIREFALVSGKTLTNYPQVYLFPAKHYLVDRTVFEKALQGITEELEEQIRFFLDRGRLTEAERLQRRTNYDLELLRETGYCAGIENYSRHLDGRQPGEPPFTLIDFFPADFLTIIDESHVTLPQLRGMLNGDRSRKQPLVDFGFRLPSSYDNRPLSFEEFEQKLPSVLFVSATPGPYELTRSTAVVEQLIRPTGLVDPNVEIRPASGQVENLLGEIHRTIKDGHRVLVTVLTKRGAEDLCDYLFDLGIRVRYLHSEVETLERARLIRSLRAGEFDVLVGINLLREGLDLPEVALVAILDADKEGFLRSEVSLIQTIGRAARNISGRVILYADRMTGSLKRAVLETERRRIVQLDYNRRYGIVPRTIVKELRDLIPDLVGFPSETEKVLDVLDQVEQKRVDRDEAIRLLTEDMLEASRNLEFERAALLRDEIMKLNETLSREKKPKGKRKPSGKRTRDDTILDTEWTRRLD
ncbi:MAG TPA: excinuclease ABC subunit UvrB [Atribacteraceae bacterium]|nr:excinuclease ABC subunit UvrB [Atribacteraceae bacterium]